MGGQLRVFLNPVGSVSPTLALELDHSTGLAVIGQTVVGPSGHLRLRSYTVASLPSPSPAGQIIYCSDLGGGAGELVSDGVRWKRTNPAGMAEMSADADATLTTLADAPTIRHTATLSADRTITLSATNAYNGARFSVARSGGGAGLLSVGGLTMLSAGSWCTVEHDGSAWRLAAAGPF
jgi:hypothetical protein